VIISLKTNESLASEKAMQELYLAYRKKVLSYIVSLVRRYPEFKGQPEDLMHDAFIVLIHRVEQGDGQLQSLYAFWIGITRHLLFNQVRKDERILLVQEPDEIYLLNDENIEANYVQAESAELIKQTFDQLGDRCKQILLLWIQGYPMDEIATKVNLSGAPMARKIKFECFKKLKNLVKDGNKWHG